LRAVLSVGHLLKVNPLCSEVVKNEKNILKIYSNLFNLLTLLSLHWVASSLEKYMK